MKAKKPKGFRSFDKLAQMLVQVPKSELPTKKKAKKRKR